MLTRRIIPCLDVIRNRVTKGVKFQNNVDLGDPVELAARYYADGCDELVVYDITASHERRPTDLGMVARVARAVRIPFAVGGGVSLNSRLRETLRELCARRGVRLLLALPQHCGDNAAMVAGLAGLGRGVPSPAAFDLEIDPSWAVE